MEPESHRLDREAMLADRLAAAERVRRELEEMEAAAAEKRSAYFDRFAEDLRAEAQARPPTAAPATPDTDREAARLLVASARAAEDVRETSRARALRTLTKARELSALVHAQTEREGKALAEMEERRVQIEREAEEILAEANRVEAEMEERRGQLEREAAAMLAGARAEADRLEAETEERRAQVVREAAGILAQARADADRVAAELDERRGQVEREADEIRARARDEAEGIVAATEEGRQRVRELLTGALASLGGEAAAPPETPDSLVADLSSRLRETTELTVT